MPVIIDAQFFESEIFNYLLPKQICQYKAALVERMKRSQVALTTEIASITKSRKFLPTRVFLTKRGIMIDLPALIKDPLTNLLRSVNSGEHEHDCTALSSMTPLDDSS